MYCLCHTNLPHASELRDGEQAKVLKRREEQCEETLRAMYQRVTETGPDQVPPMSDPGQLINAIKRIMERLKTYTASFSTHARLFLFLC